MATVFHRLPKRVARGGHIHAALHYAEKGEVRSSHLRGTPWEARNLQICLIYGWLRHYEMRGPYYITARGREMLKLLGPYKLLGYKNVPYRPAPIKTGTHVHVPKHHIPVPRWVRHFETRAW